MLNKRTSTRSLIVWVLFYAGLLPYALPLFLDWLSRPSNWWLGWGILGLGGLAMGVAISVYQAGRALTRHFLPTDSSTPSPSLHDRTSTKF